MIVRYNLARCIFSNALTTESYHPSVETGVVIADIPDTVASLIRQGWSITGVDVENDPSNSLFPGNMEIFNN